MSGGYGSDFQHVFLHALTAACPPAGTGGPPPPPKDTAPPVVGRFALTHKHFAVGPKPTALSAAKRKKPKRNKKVVGTTFSFTLSEAARAQIAITQTTKGHRASRTKRCRSARRGQKRNCAFTSTLLTLTRAHLHQGTNLLAFSGRFGLSVTERCAVLWRGR